MWQAARLLMLGAPAVFLAGCGPDSYTLRYDLKSGETLIYLQDASIRAVAAGQQPDKNSPGVDGTQELTLKVKSSEKGDARIETLVRVIPAGKKREEVKETPEPTLRFNLSEMGETDKVEDADPKKKSTLYGLPVNVSSFAVSPIRLPLRAVKIGDEWSTSAPSPLAGGSDGEVFCKFAAVETVDGIECARLDLTIVYKIALKLDTKQNVPVTLKGTISLTGSTHFALKAGRVVQLKLAGDGPLTVEETNESVVANLIFKMSTKLVK
jgi:hypothetical protein